MTLVVLLDVFWIFTSASVFDPIEMYINHCSGEDIIWWNVLSNGDIDSHHLLLDAQSPFFAYSILY